MQNDSREIEMQTYSVSYSYPVPYPSQEPYAWETEDPVFGSVVFNENFYSIPDPECAFPNEDPFDFSSEFMEDIAMPEPIFIPDYTSQASTDISSNLGPTQPVPQGTSLDEQLNFIIESTKKRPKPVETQKKYKRNRKTKAQLEVLNKELAGKLGVTKDTIRRVAKETGLKEIQVYKWYWDHKAKEA